MSNIETQALPQLGIAPKFYVHFEGKTYKRNNRLYIQFVYLFYESKTLRAVISESYFRSAVLYISSVIVPTCKFKISL